jgi:hypothetical protein
VGEWRGQIALSPAPPQNRCHRSRHHSRSRQRFQRRTIAPSSLRAR